MSGSKLAARTIVGNVLTTTSDGWAWFAVPTQRWAFRADADRLNLVIDTASRLSALAGKKLHLRITSRPYPAAAWSQALNARTPDPLPGWAEHLANAEGHVRASTMAEKEVYLGVRIADLGGVGSTVQRLRGRPATKQVVRLEGEAAIIAQALAGPGIEAQPATPKQLEWLIRRSDGLGLPAPGALSPSKGDRWETEDLAELTEGVVHETTAFAPTVQVSRRDAYGQDVTRHVAVLTVGRADEIEVPETAHEPWLAHLDKLPYPVEWSIRLDVLDADGALDETQRKLLIVRDMQRHYRDHDLDEPIALERQAQLARTIEDEMTTGGDTKGSRVHGWYRVAVAGSTREECLQRVRQIIDLYRKRQVTIAHPKGQAGLIREFVPGEPLSSTSYKRRVPTLYFAAGVPAASSSLGDRRGPYLGHTVASSRRAVMFDTHFATEVREKSGLVPIAAEPGAGKSVLQAFITYEAVRRGITSVMLDPSGPMAALCELPEFKDCSRHISLSNAPAGTLNPYGVVAQPQPKDYPDTDALEEARTLAAQDRKALASDILTMLLPASVAADKKTAKLIGNAVRSTSGAPETSLWALVEHLSGGDGDAQEIADILRDMAEMPLARLFFPPSGTSATATMDKTLTVLTLPGLVLPPSGVAREHWSTSERLAIPLLHLASWFASKTIYGRPRDERKLVALDEVHFLGEWGAGRALFTRLGRDSRKWNTCVLAASQNPADILGMEVSNFVSAAFVGRIEDEQVAADALRMLRVPADVGYESVLQRLSPRSLTSERSGVREFVMRDVDGHVDRMRVDLDHLPHLLAALDTTAAPKAERERVVVAAARVEEVTPIIDLAGRRPSGTGFPAAWPVAQ